MPSLATASVLPEALLGNSIAGRYLLRSVLGRGGMGAVYRASCPDGPDVAVKVILDRDGEIDSKARKRAAREASVCGRINHRNIVRIIDSGEDDSRGAPFLVMELLQGEDLAHVIRRLGPLPPVTAVRIFRQVLEGLQAAHELRLVHRDIKPSNIFLHGDQELTCKICDFGIARPIRVEGEPSETTSTLTEQDKVVGSPRYMSPEQTSGKPVDPRTDLWCVGVSLYESLCGENPWGHRATRNELVGAILHEKPSPLRGIAPWVPSGLVRVIERSLAKRGDERYETASQFRDALAPWSGDSDAIDASMIRALAEREKHPLDDEPGMGETRTHRSRSRYQGWRVPLAVGGACTLLVGAAMATNLLRPARPSAPVPTSTGAPPEVSSQLTLPASAGSAAQSEGPQTPFTPSSPLPRHPAPRVASPQPSAPKSPVPVVASAVPAATSIRPPSTPPVATKVVTEEWQ